MEIIDDFDSNVRNHPACPMTPRIPKKQIRVPIPSYLKNGFILRSANTIGSYGPTKDVCIKFYENSPGFQIKNTFDMTHQGIQIITVRGRHFSST